MALRDYASFTDAGLKFTGQAGPNGDEPGTAFTLGDYRIDISVREIAEMISVIENATEESWMHIVRKEARRND